MSTDSPILDKIRALVAPPQSATSRSASRKRGNPGGREEHRGGHKKSGSGRMANHEFCDACREGGDLLCCDSCPAAFHFNCHDPPVDPAQLPEGDWKCRKCTNVDAPNTFSYFLKDQAHKLNKSNATQFSLPPTYAKNMILPGDKRETAKMPNGQLSTMPPLSEHDKLFKDLVDRELCFYCNKSSQKGPLVLCDFCPLVFHLDCLDPPLTNVPTRLWMCPCHPHHAMEDFEHPRVTKRIEVMEMFQKPVDIEAVKRKLFLQSIKSNILTKDTVFTFYLKPPPTDVPESIKSLYADPLPRGTTPSLLETLFTPKEQVLYIASEFDIKLPVPCGVPRTEESDEATRTLINSHIQSSPGPPSPALAPASVSEATAAELTNDYRGDPLQAVLSDPDIVDDEMIQTAYSLLRIRYAFQSLLNPEQYPRLPEPEPDPSDPNAGVIPQIPPLAEILKAPDKPPPVPPNIPKPANTSKQGPSTRGKEKGVKRTRNGYKSRGELGPSGEERTEAVGAETSEPAALSEDNAPNVSRFQKLIHGTDPEKTPKVRPLPISPDISKLDPKLVQYLALERLRQLLPDSHALLSENSDKAAMSNTSALYKKFEEHDLRPPKPQPKGVLLPLTGSGPPIQLERRKISIGTNSEMDIRLGEYGTCGFVSGHHARIFYDKITDRFELLNYSPYGTAVDRTLYGLDASRANPTCPMDTPLYVSDVHAGTKGAEGDRGLRMSTLRRSKIWETKHILYRTKSYLSSGNDLEIGKEEAVSTSEGEGLLAQRRGEARVPLEGEFLLAEDPGTKVRCKCLQSRRQFEKTVGGWEGNGLLRHGSEIAFGCVGFVLSLSGYPGHDEVSSLLKTLRESKLKADGDT